jgi:hypothetical protein
MDYQCIYLTSALTIVAAAFAYKQGYSNGQRNGIKIGTPSMAKLKPGSLEKKVLVMRSDAGLTKLPEQEKNYFYIPSTQREDL